jgi:hypothetical protein
MLESASDPDGTAFLGFIGFEDEATAASNITGGFVHWKTGKNSMLMMLRHGKKWGTYYGLLPRYNYKFSGNAGGRIFICPSAEEAADNADSRQVYIEGTSQPLTFYGLNVECTKLRTTNPNIDKLGTNVEIVNASNIRIHSMKREGRSPTVIIRDSRNIAVYGMGRLNVTVPPELGGYNQILGNSDGIVFATVVLDTENGTAGFPILRESITGQNPVQIDWPDNVSIYKRGELTDEYLTSNNSDHINEPTVNLAYYPNPSNGELNIQLSGIPNQQICLNIIGCQGQLIKKLYEGTVINGQILQWDGKDFSGNTAPPGLYLINLSSPFLFKTEKIILNHSF